MFASRDITFLKGHNVALELKIDNLSCIFKPDTTSTNVTVATSQSTVSKVYSETKTAANEELSAGTLTKSPVANDGGKSQQEVVKGMLLLGLFLYVY